MLKLKQNEVINYRDVYFSCCVFAALIFLQFWTEFLEHCRKNTCGEFAHFPSTPNKNNRDLHEN